MVSQPARRSAGSRNEVDVQVAFVFAGESDLRSVRREDRIGLQSDAIGQSLGIAAFARHDPEVPGEGKGHVRPADRRLLEEERFVLFCPTGRRYCQYGNQSKNDAFHDFCAFG